MLPALLLAVLAVDFQPRTIATGLRGGYQVVAADLNHDGRPDLIALGSGMREIYWFENPGWQRHVLARDVAQLINLDVWDGQVVLAHGFSMQIASSAGIVSLLTPGADPSQPWALREIDRLPTSHRVRWADIDGSGRKVAVNAPLIGGHAVAPDYRDHVPLVCYRPGQWKRELISDANQGVMHGLTVVRWGPHEAILTASFSGIHLYQYDRGRWRRTEISRGDPAPWPKGGASDVALAHDGNRRFLAAIEPWHGHEVVFYREQGDQWQREVVDDTLADGHGVYAADLDGDGREEIVVASRGTGVRIYTAAGVRQVVDDSIAAASCAVADLNGDGRLDLACIGSATANLKWYENKR